MKRFALFCLLAILCSESSSFAKAAFCGFEEMVRRSDVIALVDVTEIKEKPVQGSTWTYGQTIIAKPVEVLKGRVQSPLSIYGMENFICAQCRFAKGPQLVFLKKDGDLLAGSNWHLSVRPVENGQIAWFKNSTSLELVPAPASDVLSQVRAEIKRLEQTPSDPAVKNKKSG